MNYDQINYLLKNSLDDLDFKTSYELVGTFNKSNPTMFYGKLSFPNIKKPINIYYSTTYTKYDGTEAAFVAHGILKAEVVVPGKWFWKRERIELKPKDFISDDEHQKLMKIFKTMFYDARQEAFDKKRNNDIETQEKVMKSINRQLDKRSFFDMIMDDYY